MDLIDDHRANRREHASATDRREHYVQRFRRGDEYVRRLADHSRTRRRRCITRADCDANLGELLPGFCEAFLQLRQWPLEIALDVVVQRFQRRDVKDVNRVRERRREPIDDEVVQLPEERGERLACAGRRENERVRATRNRRPPLPLWRARAAEGFVKPLPDEWMEWLESGRHPRALRHDTKAARRAWTALGKMELQPSST